MLTDLEIASGVAPKHIAEIAESLHEETESGFPAANTLQTEHCCGPNPAPLIAIVVPERTIIPWTPVRYGVTYQIEAPLLHRTAE